MYIRTPADLTLNVRVRVRAKKEDRKLFITSYFLSLVRRTGIPRRNPGGRRKS